MRQPPLPVLRKSSGAFDLPSIITGVVVVGILAAGVLAAIFGVIPFAQDRGAKQDLSSIRTAEGVAKAKDNRFMDHQRLLDIGYLQLSSTEKTKVKADAKGTCYVGIARSGTGTLFYSTDTNTDPQVLEADTVTGCLTEEELAELIDDVGGIEEDVDNASALNLVAVSALEAKATWAAVKDATGYKVEYQVNDGAWIMKSVSTTATAAALYALPEDTINARVTVLQDGDVAEPMSATVRLPDSVLKNPGFEQGSAGWTLVYNGSIDTKWKHSGNNSAYLSTGYNGSIVSQAVTIPSETPILTFWSSGTEQLFLVNSTPYPMVAMGSGQYKVDLSSLAGKTVTIGFTTTRESKSWFDDVAFTTKMVPDRPASVSVTSRQSAAMVTWTRPSFTGGLPITSYTVTAWTADGKRGTSVMVPPDQLTATLTGVTAGTAYNFTVSATNAIGESEQSAAIAPVEILNTAIANPGFEQGSAGWTLVYNGSIDTKWKHSGKNSAYLSSGYLGSIVSQAVTIPSETPILTFWSSGTEQRFLVDSTQYPMVAMGSGQYKVDLSGLAGKTVTIGFTTTRESKSWFDDVAFTTVMVPDKPTSVSVTSRQSAATATWSRPSFTGGLPITTYTVTASTAEGKREASVIVPPDQLTATLTGVTAGTAYNFTVSATNAIGESEQSAAIAPVEILSTAIANPGFEQGSASWTLNSSSIDTKWKHSGKNSAYLRNGYLGSIVSQAVTVPSETPILTFWSSGSKQRFLINSTQYAMVAMGSGQYKVDLSGLAGKTVTIGFTTTGESESWFDDVAFAPKN